MVSGGRSRPEWRTRAKAGGKAAVWGMVRLMRQAFWRMKRGLMTAPLSRFVRSLALAAALAAPLAPARALVGAEPDSRFAGRVAMVLIRGGDKAGFCTALVLSPRVLLTAAHCLRPLRDIAVHYRDAAGAAVIIPVDAAIAHPLYRADAIEARALSIDLALIRTVRPLLLKVSPARRSLSAGLRRSAPRSSFRASARRARATGRRAASCAASPLPCASRRRPFSSGPPIRPERRPARAMAIRARRSGRRTGQQRSRSSPGRRPRTVAAAAG